MHAPSECPIKSKGFLMIFSIKNKISLKRDSLFRIYSMSKPITGVALMILLEEGKVRQEDAGNIAWNLMLGKDGPVRKLIDDYCGGMLPGHEFKAFFPGGASGGIFPARMSDMGLDFGIFEPHGGFVGSHAVIILSDKDSILDAVINTIKFFKHESCGQCTPCRSGTDKMISLLEDNNKELDLYNEPLYHLHSSLHKLLHLDLV